jgi:16S rRNA A1518/A1519 N6-dimethyltransferase RsmA/KsgA/DIM1 with predicted DNA glycosylase/AP lyase activity
MRIAGRVPAASFTPPPQVAAAHLSIRPRPLAASADGQRLLRRLLRAAYLWPDAPVHDVLRDAAARGGPGRRGSAALARAGVPPNARAAQLTADQWHRVATGALRDRPDSTAQRRP